MPKKSGKYNHVKNLLKQKACSIDDIADVVYPRNQPLGLKRRRRIYAAIAYLRQSGINVKYSNGKYYIND